VRFALSRASYAELAAYDWPGNVRELELLIANASVFALADAVGAAEHGRGAREAATIPIPAKLVRELLAGFAFGAVRASDERASDERARDERARDEGGFVVRPRGALRDVARDLERQLFERLYRECGGDFEAMARALLEGEDPAAGRKVRMRFLQLGLRVRRTRR
jgi:DNA-binding NtrC family response regulator